MEIHVTFIVDASVHDDVFTCENASRQMFSGGKANILFKPSPGVDRKGRKVLSAQYAQACAIYTYED